MITIASPSVALNDDRSPILYYMDHDIAVHPDDSQQAIVDSVLSICERQDGGAIQELVVNTHGLPGSLLLGTGLNVNTLGPWQGLRGRVSKIWFTGCLVARVMPADPSSGDYSALRQANVTRGNGDAFMQAFAISTGAYCLAPTEIQGSGYNRTDWPCPRGRIDTYEGLLLSYNPRGRLHWRRRYPSLTPELPNNE